MDWKQWSLLVLALVLIGGIIYIATVRSAPPDLQIAMTIRPNAVPANRRADLGPAIQRQRYTVSFALSRESRLESVKVVKVHEIETNRFARPVWELVAESSSIPVQSLTYGVPVRGMKPKIDGAQAEALEPGVTYRLLLETTGQDASYDFSLKRR